MRWSRSGPRGEAARRLRTHATRVVMDLGPYRVVGLVHGTPASDPLATALRRAAWLPLTDATVTYRRGPDSVSDEVETLLVNRPLASSFRPLEEASVALPREAAAPTPPDTKVARARPHGSLTRASRGRETGAPRRQAGRHRA